MKIYKFIKYLLYVIVKTLEKERLVQRKRMGL
jgi:hypothetical protein